MAPDPSQLRVVCPRCGDHLLQRRRGEWTLQQKTLKFVAGAVVAVCPGCGDPVSVPCLQLVAPETAAKAADPAPLRPRLVVRVDGAAGG